MSWRRISGYSKPKGKKKPKEIKIKRTIADRDFGRNFEVEKTIKRWVRTLGISFHYFDLDYHPEEIEKGNLEYDIDICLPYEIDGPRPPKSLLDKIYNGVRDERHIRLITDPKFSSTEEGSTVWYILFKVRYVPFRK